MADESAYRALELEAERQEAAGQVDPSALLVALVLVPHSYPRNKFYRLFRDKEAAAVRRRAALLRSLIADLAGDASEVQLAVVDGEAVLTYRLEEVGVARRSVLSATELSLVRRATERVKPRPELAGPFDGLMDAPEIDAVVERLWTLA
ncbi:MAG: hypothetical protein KC731_38400 [Myxococcales bacterium]|nr:hypothetical protein [Myxococcales bacterium]